MCDEQKGQTRVWPFLLPFENDEEEVSLSEGTHTRKKTVLEKLSFLEKAFVAVFVAAFVRAPTLLLLHFSKWHIESGF